MSTRYLGRNAGLAAVSDAVDVLVHDERELEWQPIKPPLTARQREIVTLVSQGLSNKEVARRLNLSDGTVKVHLHRIYGRMRIRGRTALAAFVMRSRSDYLLLLTLAGNAVLAI